MGPPMFVVTQKLKAVRLALKNLHTIKYTKLAARVASQEKILKQVQSNALNDPTNVSLCETEKAARDNFKQLVNEELGLMRQKAKVEWLDQMDTNSAFFHSKVKERHNQCRISSIQDSQGNLLTDMKEVQEEFLSFYDAISGTKQ